MLEIFTPTKFQLAEGPYISYEMRNIAAYRGPNYRRNAACEAPVGIENPSLNLKSSFSNPAYIKFAACQVLDMKT